MRQLLLTLVPAVLLCVAPAQNVRAFGEVVRQSGVFSLECGGLELRSTTVDLSDLVGEVADLQGTLQGGNPPVLQVDSAERSDSLFELRGDSSIGGDVRFRVESPIGRTYYLLAASRPGFVPLDGVVPLASGTFFLDRTRAFAFFSGELRGSWEESRPIPNDPDLVGLELWFQGAILPRQTPFIYLNCARLTVVR